VKLEAKMQDTSERFFREQWSAGQKFRPYKCFNEYSDIGTLQIYGITGSLSCPIFDILQFFMTFERWKSGEFRDYK
jgi:hypothetical protein